MEKTITFKLNGKTVRVSTSPERMLLWVLRSDLELTGAKYSCGEGFCRACTVLINDEAVLSCQYPLHEVNGKEITTIEGLQDNGKLHPLQTAFIRHNALQCGFCTPGMLMAAKGLLNENSKPSEEEVRRAIAGNLCRCTGYNKTVEAILDTAERLDALT